MIDSLLARVFCSLRKLKQKKKNNPMKQLQTSLLLTAALFLAAASAYTQAAKSSPAAGASGTPSTPPTIGSAIDREISIVEKEIVEAAEAMPEDKFDFSPEKLSISGSDYKGVRTFGQQLKHVAASNYLIWSPITGEKAPDTVNALSERISLRSGSEPLRWFGSGGKLILFVLE